jgi:hypothetical protein
MRETVLCPTGKRVFGGGAQVAGEGTANFHTVIQESTPGQVGSPAVDAWLVALVNNDTRAHTIRLTAICGFAA